MWLYQPKCDCIKWRGLLLKYKNIKTTHVPWIKRLLKKYYIKKNIARSHDENYIKKVGSWRMQKRVSKLAISKIFRCYLVTTDGCVVELYKLLNHDIEANKASWYCHIRHPDIAILHNMKILMKYPNDNIYFTKNLILKVAKTCL